MTFTNGLIVFSHPLFIATDGVAAENLLIEPMINTMIDYLKNVTKGVDMVLTKIDGENRGKIQFTNINTQPY